MLMGRMMWLVLLLVMHLLSLVLLVSLVLLLLTRMRRIRRIWLPRRNLSIPPLLLLVLVPKIRRQLHRRLVIALLLVVMRHMLRWLRGRRLLVAMVLAGDFVWDCAREDAAQPGGGAGGAQGGRGGGGGVAVEVRRGVRLDWGIGHLDGALGWWWLLVRWWGRGGHHDRAGVGPLHLGCEGREGVARAGVVDECYAEHLGLASWCWWCLLGLVEAGTADGLGGWWWGRRGG